MKHLLTITHEHLRRALAVPWSTTTCLTSQAIAEHFGVAVLANGITSVELVNGTQIICPNAAPFACDFDGLWNLDGKRLAENLNPQRLANLEAKLPVTVEIEVLPQ